MAAASELLLLSIITEQEETDTESDANDLFGLRF